MLVEKFESKHTLYSQLRVEEIVNRKHMTKSGWSDIEIQHVKGRKEEDSKSVINYLVAKKTQPCRHRNETSILQLLKDVRCIFISRYYRSDHPEHADRILNEYCPYKSVDNYLHSHSKFVSLSTKMLFLFEIAIGIRFLRDNGIYHNDIKPANILLKVMGSKLQSTFFMRIIDFGESQSPFQPIQLQRNSADFKRGCTVPYAPPEQVKFYRYN